MSSKRRAPRRTRAQLKQDRAAIREALKAGPRTAARTGMSERRIKRLLKESGLEMGGW
jgi:hypothetical protein